MRSKNQRVKDWQIKGALKSRNEPKVLCTSGWQPLEEHLKNVAELARRFAEDFGAGDWGYLAGLWHDMGR
jgi:hypothetical protein